MAKLDIGAVNENEVAAIPTPRSGLWSMLSRFAVPCSVVAPADLQDDPGFLRARFQRALPFTGIFLSETCRAVNAASAMNRLNCS